MKKKKKQMLRFKTRPIAVDSVDAARAMKPDGQQQTPQVVQNYMVDR